MLNKYLIKAKIEVLTGLHIRGGEGFSAIGAVDKVVIKDPISNLPIIPGSSLKGKIRSLLAKERGSKKPSSDGIEIMRLFGGSGDKIIMGRLQFFDCFLANYEELKGEVTEIKFENTINRETGIANPRQNERVVRGAVFDFNLVYNADDKNEIEDDFILLAEGLKLLQLDYLGGNGTRGYGRISFKNIKVFAVDEKDADTELLERLNAILKDANEYAKLFN